MMVIVILLTLLIPACSINRKTVNNGRGVTPAITVAPTTEITVTPTEAPDTITPTVSEEEEKEDGDEPVPTPIISKKYNAKGIDDIRAAVKDMKNILLTSWSSDNTVLAFAIENEDNTSYGQVYLWKVGEREPVFIDEEFVICDICWSRDEKYFYVDSGTDVVRGGALVSIVKAKKVTDIGYLDHATWSPDSKCVAFASESDVESSVAVGNGCTYDLVIVNAETGKKKIIETGTRDYLFFPGEWDKDGTLHYSKEYFSEDGEGKKEELVYKYELQ
jgi:hypothetical protein